MNYDIYVESYKNKKRSVRDHSKKVMLTRMVIHNIKDIIPTMWEIRSDYVASITINPKENIEPTVKDFDKLCARLTRCLGKKPYMTVDKSSFNASYYIYPSFITKCWECINIDITTDNKENCDFIEKTVETKIYEPSGYCAIIANRQYDLVKRPHEKTKSR